MNFRIVRTYLIAALAIWLVCLEFATGAPPTKVTVTSANPAAALQGETLDVVIGGTGFDAGSSVKFLVTGSKDDTQINVGAVVLNPDGTLTASIQVSNGAMVTDYDIEVRTSSGRRGKGTTLFSVRQDTANIVTLDITYEFGEPDGSGACTPPACVASTVTATGAVDCDVNGCAFNTRAEDALFALPSGFRDLMIETEWRGTALDPDTCFGSDAADPVGMAMLGTDETGTERNIVFLSWYSNGVSPWYASVGTFARDVDDLQDRQYIFNFEGCGADGNCGAFTPGSMAGDYVGGELIRIDSHGNDRKFASIPCRCTRSNTPNCPDDVPVPTPPIRISVVEIP